MENTTIGPFLVLNRIGSNRRQKVFHARQIEQNRDIALKFISVPGKVDWSTVLSKIEIEFEELKKLKHPNLARIYGAGVHEDQIFVATELVAGESLATLLTRRGRLPVDLAIDIGRQIAVAVGYLHQQDLIHSKLTPDKILFTPSGQIKIVDLRLNRARRRRWDTSRLKELDLAAYQAPEQFKSPATPKSDLYTLGVIFYEMLTGKLPFEATNLSSMKKEKVAAKSVSVSQEVIHCPAVLDRLIAKMIHPEPRKRPHSARAILLTLDEINKMDVSGKSNVAQLSGGFNPLTSGIDQASRKEAKRLLIDRRKRVIKESPFYESVPFLFTCLLSLAVLVGILAWPASLQSQIEKNMTLLQTENLEDAIQARRKLRDLIDRHPQSDQIETLNQLLDRAQRSILVQRADQEIALINQSEAVKNFTQAWQLAKSDRVVEALQQYQRLIDSLSPNDSEFYISREALAQREGIKAELKMPDEPDQVLNLIDFLKSARSEDEFAFSFVWLQQIADRFGNQMLSQEETELTPDIANFTAILDKANKVQIELQQKMEQRLAQD